MINNVFRKIFAYNYNGIANKLKMEKGESDGFEFWKIDKILNISDENKEKFISSLVSKKHKDIFEKIKQLTSK